MAEFTQQQLLDLVNTAHVAPGNARVRAITARVVSDLFKTIDELDVQPDEFWRAVDWLARLGASGQLGLITAGLGFDRLLDIRADEADRAGRPGRRHAACDRRPAVHAPARPAQRAKSAWTTVIRPRERSS